MIYSGHCCPYSFILPTIQRHQLIFIVQPQQLQKYLSKKTVLTGLHIYEKEMNDSPVFMMILQA